MIVSFSTLLYRFASPAVYNAVLLCNKAYCGLPFLFTSEYSARSSGGVCATPSFVRPSIICLACVRDWGLWSRTAILCPFKKPLKPWLAQAINTSIALSACPGQTVVAWGRYRGGRRPSCLHSTTVILPSALDKPSIMKRYHRRRTCSHTSPRTPTMETLRDTRFVECRWWNDGWTVKTVVTWRPSASVIPAPGLLEPSFN